MRAEPASVKKQYDLQVRKFNPGTFQSDQTVIEQFVVRNRELGTVLDVLRGNIDAPSCQHMLVVAPRGRGKSMLLARVVAELRTNREFSKRLFPVRFMEESQEIFNIADFWLEALFYLASQLTKTNPDLSQELRATLMGHKTSIRPSSPTAGILPFWGSRSVIDRQ